MRLGRSFGCVNLHNDDFFADLSGAFLLHTRCFMLICKGLLLTEEPNFLKRRGGAVLLLNALCLDVNHVRLADVYSETLVPFTTSVCTGVSSGIVNTARCPMHAEVSVGS